MLEQAPVSALDVPGEREGGQHTQNTPGVHVSHQVCTFHTRCAHFTPDVRISHPGSCPRLLVSLKAAAEDGSQSCACSSGLCLACKAQIVSAEKGSHLLVNISAQPLLEQMDNVEFALGDPPWIMLEEWQLC